MLFLVIVKGDAVSADVKMGRSTKDKCNVECQGCRFILPEDVLDQRNIGNEKWFECLVAQFEGKAMH